MAKVLIVLDGEFRFTTGTSAAPDFTYVELVSALTAAGHQVTKAHRQSDAGADHQTFNFDTSVNLLDFDVLWLIGKDGRNSTTSTGNSPAGIPDAEVRALARFMAAGGGVFATGDHDGIGSVMCGRIPRVRAMRCWFGINDATSPMPGAFPRNFPVLTTGRADTTQRNPGGNYADTTFVWFENQSDTVPQPITPTTSPAHPILRRGGADIVVYPDHMHEGNTLGEVMGYDYTQSLSFSGQSFAEFPEVAGNREMPEVIATGQTMPFASKNVASGAFVGMDSAASALKTVNSLSVYDGRAVGVGRIVTGSTFHHYVDINLSGDSSVDTAPESTAVGPNAEKGHGFNDAPATFADIKAVFVNITNWLARPRPAIQLILERSTFSQDEVTASPNFDGAILVYVDGLKPNQFPGTGISTLSPSQAQLNSWAPTVTPVGTTDFEIVPTDVDSDDPLIEDRLQRFTFTYRVHFTNPTFGFMGPSLNVPVDAALNSPAVSGTLTDSAIVQLVKSANPFMLDLDNGNQTAWLSSDVRVFRAVAGANTLGQMLPNNANRSQALQYLRDVLQNMTINQFENNLAITQAGSALSPFPQTTGFPQKKVYNFAVARVRLNNALAPAMNVRVFFRIVPSPTTAALTYHESAGIPIGSYKETPGPDPIAIPGTNGAGTEWVSFPCFLAPRVSPPESQTDSDNVKTLPATTGSSTFFGALLDNNLNDAYLPATPGGGGAVDLPTLMMGEHQCIVAQIEYTGTSIPEGATPFTSDKLAQRNLAFSAVANPGLDASRMALHTFEIEVTPNPVGDLRPDELLLDWRDAEPPDGTEVRIFIPSWNANNVVELADRFYPRHELRAIDAHTIALPGGGVRYVPIPSSATRQTGVLIADLPLGVKQGQRFDLAVRQITTRGRVVVVPPKVETISKAEAAKLLQGLKESAKKGNKKITENTRGVFDLGGNRVLVTDLSVLDATGDFALIIEHPDRAKLEAAKRESRDWRETIGAFQLGIPVSVKAEMLPHYLRLLSVLRWRAEQLRPNNRWYATFVRYVELIAEKVRALGGDPWKVPPTPDGAVPLPGDKGGDAGGGDTSSGGVGGSGGVGDPLDPYFEPQGDDWLSDTTGLGAPDKVAPGIWSGKVSGLLFDHFGDFEGFTLESYGGTHHRFFSREAAIRDLARTAWIERYVVTVITVSAQSRRVRRLLIRGYAG